MDYKQYTFVGWVAIINAIATIPLLVFNIIMEQLAKQWIGVNPIIMLSMGVIVLVDTFLYYKFRELLNHRYQFHEADTIILLIIHLNIPSTSWRLSALTSEQNYTSRGSPILWLQNSSNTFNTLIVTFLWL